MSDAAAESTASEPLPATAEIELELDMEPTRLIRARRELLDAPSREALASVVDRLRKDLSESERAQLRPVLAERVDYFDAQRAARSAPAPAPKVTPAHGVAVAAAAAVQATSPADVAPISAPVSAAPTVTVEPRPLLATWREIKTSGLYRGQWGVAVEHIQHGVAIEPPRIGDVALVNRRNGPAQCKRIAAVVKIDADRGYSLCAVSDPPPGVRATVARPRRAVQQAMPVAPVAAVPTTPVSVAPTSIAAASRPQAPEGLATALASLATIDSGLAEGLGAAVIEGAGNAAMADLGAQSTSHASSSSVQRRGVGFSSWEGYREALRRGGLQPHTHAEYIAMVRRHVTPEEIAAFPPPNAAPTLPVGKGIVHEASGPSVFDMTAEQRKAHLRVGKSAEKLTGAALMRRGDVIIGALLAGAGGEFGWEGLGEIKRGKLVESLTEIGRPDDAPPAKDAHAQLGRAVRSLNATRYDVHAVRGDNKPEAIGARYVVIDRSSLPDGSQAISAGITIGARATAEVEIALTVDMLEDGTVSYYGDAALADKVRADYALRTSEQTLTSADITSWLQGLLVSRHGATRYGSHWYVPGGQRDAVVTLTRAIAGTHWGRYWIHGATLATEEAVIEGMLESFADEITTVDRKWQAARDKARADYNEIDELGKRKRQTEDLTARGAVTHLRDLQRVRERVTGYAAALFGEDAIKGHLARINRLDAEIRPLCDDTSIRGVMLEFE